MTVEEQLKDQILMQYRSVRAFTNAANIPYSTMDSIFKRGIANAGVGTVIKIFGTLGLDIESIRTGKLEKSKSAPTLSGDTAGALTPQELSRLSDAMAQMNAEGRERVVEYAEDLVAGGRFKKPYSVELGEKKA